MLTSWLTKHSRSPTFSFWTSNFSPFLFFSSKVKPSPCPKFCFLVYAMMNLYQNGSCLCQQSVCPLVIPPSAINMLTSFLSRKQVTIKHDFHSALPVYECLSSFIQPSVTWLSPTAHDGKGHCIICKPHDHFSAFIPWPLYNGPQCSSASPTSPLFLGIHSWPLILSRLCKSPLASSHANPVFLLLALHETVPRGLLPITSAG